MASSIEPVRIALIDDDSGLATVLELRFDALRWQHERFAYAPGIDHLAGMRLHGVLLNPALTGVDYVERLAKAAPGLAVLAIAGHATVSERVRGLRAGADDWITKPCHPEELVARVEAVLRRRRAGERPADGGQLTAGELTIRPEMFDAYVGDEPAGLSRKEYELLRQLAAAGGRVLEREVVYQRVWGYTMVRGDRSVDVFVRKLRTKLERLSPDWRYVHTHFGIGYRFAAQRAVPAPGGTEAGPQAPAPAGLPRLSPADLSPPTPVDAPAGVPGDPNYAYR